MRARAHTHTHTNVHTYKCAHTFMNQMKAICRLVLEKVGPSPLTTEPHRLDSAGGRGTQEHNHTALIRVAIRFSWNQRDSNTTTLLSFSWEAKGHILTLL